VSVMNGMGLSGGGECAERGPGTKRTKRELVGVAGK
jgi:hypothetical protein